MEWAFNRVECGWKMESGKKKSAHWRSLFQGEESLDSAL